MHRAGAPRWPTTRYKWMPRVRLRWDDVWIGAAVTALLFTLGKQLIGTYLGRSGITSGFGAAASLVAMVVWVYYSAQIFLLGVESGLELRALHFHRPQMSKS